MPLVDLLLGLGDGLLPLDHPRPLGDVAATDQDGGKAGANLFHQNRLTPTLTTVLCLSSSFLSSAALLTPVTKGDIGLLDLKLKLSKERDKLDLKNSIQRLIRKYQRIENTSELEQESTSEYCSLIDLGC